METVNGSKEGQKDANEIFCFVKLLNILNNIDEFLNWFSNNVNFSLQAEIKKKTIFQGYRFILNTIWNSLIHEVIDSDIFDLSEDYIYFRASSFVDTPLSQIPINCEKTAFLKTLDNLGKSLSRSKTWDELKENLLKINPFLIVLKEIYDKYIFTIEYNKEEALNLGAQNCLYEYFHQYHHSKPKIWIKMFNRPKNWTLNYLVIILPGYIYTLQYLWRKLLKDKFDASIIAKIDRIIPTLNFLQKNKEELILFNFKQLINDKSVLDRDFLLEKYYLGGEMVPSFQINDEETFKDILKNEERLKHLFIENRKEFENFYDERKKHYDIIFNDLNKQKTTIETIKNSINRILQNEDDDYFKDLKKNLLHFHLDIEDYQNNKIIEEEINQNVLQYFFRIERKIVEILEVYIERVFRSKSFLSKRFYSLKFVDKRFIAPYFSDFNKMEFEESKFSNEIEAIQFFEAKMYYYRMNILNSALSYDFNGIRPLISLIIGEISDLKKHKSLDTIRIKIFKHASSTKEGDISVGLLIKSFGNFTDKSGWLIFYECATYGYSGYGPSLYRKILDTIKENELYISWEEIFISKQLFKRILQKHSIKPPEINFKKKMELINYISDQRGRLFESMVYKWVSYKNLYSKILWNEKINKEEFDVIGFSSNKQIDYLECKITLDNRHIDYVVRKIKDKVNVLERKYEKIPVKPFIVIYEYISKKQISIFESNKIMVLHNFREYIRNDNAVFQKAELYINLIEDFKKFGF